MIANGKLSNSIFFKNKRIFAWLWLAWEADRWGTGDAFRSGRTLCMICRWFMELTANERPADVQPAPFQDSCQDPAVELWEVGLIWTSQHPEATLISRRSPLVHFSIIINTMVRWIQVSILFW